MQTTATRPYSLSTFHLPSQWYRGGTIILLLFTWAALLFRLNDVPPGFQHDQMFQMLDALDVVRGHYRIYFPANFGREPVGIYTAAGVLHLTGGHYVWSLRFSSVLWGMLGVALTVALACRYLPRGAALLATALMASSFWFLFAARLGLEPIALLPLAMGMVYFLDRGLQGANGSLSDYLAAGIFGGLAVYTYLPSRGLYLLVPLLLAYELVSSWVQRRRTTGQGMRPSPALLGGVLDLSRLGGLLLTLLLMVLVSLPLQWYLVSHPQTADRRLAELGGPLTAASHGDLGPVLARVSETALSIVWAGPPAIPYQYNVPGRPALQPILAAFFLIGLVLTLARWRRREFLLLAALLIGLAPVMLTGADALYMRGIISLPLLFIITARGLWAIAELAWRGIERLTTRWRGSSTAYGQAGGPEPAQTASQGVSKELGPVRARVLSSTEERQVGQLSQFQASWRFLPAAGVLMVLLWHMADSSYAYFVTWAQGEPTQRIYNADLRAAAAFLDANPAPEQVFIGTDRLLDLDQKTYQAYEPKRQDVGWFQLPGSPPLPAERPDGSGQGDALYFLPGSVRELSPTLALLAGVARGDFTIPGPSGRYPLVRGLRLNRADVEEALRQHGVVSLSQPLDFGDTLRLEAAGAQDRGANVEVLSRWAVLGSWPFSPPPGYAPSPPKLSAALTDATGHKWAQEDIASDMPFRTWQPGQSLLEATQITLPADIPPGQYNVHLLVYDDVGGTLPVRSAGRDLAVAPAVARVQVSQADNRGAPPQPPHLVQQTLGGDLTRGAIRLLGKWEALDSLLAGVPADVHLSWQMGQPAEAGASARDTSGLRFQLRATGPDGALLWEQAADPLTPLPAAWPAGQVYRLTHRLYPQTPNPGITKARLDLCVLERGRPLACAILGQPQVVNRPPLLVLSVPPQHPTGANWGGEFSLAGYDLARDDEGYALTLYWKTENPPRVALSRFVHAVDDSGQIVTQADGTPDNGGIPMPLWRPGEYVVDRVVLKPPPGRDVGQFYVGWYDPETGTRLPLRLSPGGGEMAAGERFVIPASLHDD